MTELRKRGAGGGDPDSTENLSDKVTASLLPLSEPSGARISLLGRLGNHKHTHTLALPQKQTHLSVSKLTLAYIMLHTALTAHSSH